MSEYRKDPVLNQWVVIAPERAVPYNLIKENPENEEKEFEPSCPFCAINPEETKVLLKYNIEDKNNWDLLVIPAPNPFLRVETELKKEAEGIYDLMSGTGANEIIIESPKHNEHIFKSNLNKIEQIFWAYRDRILDLKKDIRLEYLLFYKENKTNGITHPHSKMIATPFIPSMIETELLGAEDYFSYKDRCVFCDIVKQELKDGIRVVSQNQEFVSICPYASRNPFEVWIIPKNHQSHFEMSSKNQFYHLADIYLDTFKRLHKALGNIPYLSVLHNSPIQEESLEFYHWHIEIHPVIPLYQGEVFSAGLYVNPVAPEEAAKELREKI